MIYAVVSVAVLAIIWLLFDNKRLTVSRYKIEKNSLPNAFSGLKILQLSDIHGAGFGKDFKRLIFKVKKEFPDIIVITGDLIDARAPKLARAIELVKKLITIAPVFFVSGNHEARYDGYPQLEKELKEIGVKVLENESFELLRDNEKIVIEGVKDPRFTTDYNYENSLAVVRSELEKTDVNLDCFRVLLSHRPELFSCYCDRGIDLVFSGHAHGGQFRLPFIGGLFVPNQGLFPKYDAGVVSSKETTMVISRGLGKSIIPLRIGNPPDIVVVLLTKSHL